MDATPSPGAAPDEAAATARLHRRRVIILLLALLAFAISYAALFADLYNRPSAGEQVFTAGPGGKLPLDIYLEVLNVDPVRQAFQARLDFAVKAEPDGVYYDAAPPSDAVVYESDGYDIQATQLKAGVRSPSTSMEFDVSGRIENYPVDQYEGKILIRVFEGSADARGAAMQVNLTTWAELSGWYVTVAKNTSTADSSGISLRIEVHRAHAQVFFAFLLYAAMVLIGGSALTICGLAFVGTRRIEATLVSALGAMVFAVPALRNIMPGAPPLGVRADAIVFLWVQLTVILGLTIYVGTWARRGPSP